MKTNYTFRYACNSLLAPSSNRVIRFPQTLYIVTIINPFACGSLKCKGVSDAQMTVISINLGIA